MATRRSAVLFATFTIALVLATSLFATPRASANEVVVVVQPGDTLTSIATRYGTTVASIAALNGIANPDQIRAGERIRVKASGPKRSGTKAAGPSNMRRHVVRPGETLTSIAADYRITIDAIAAANHLADPSYVQAGQVLLIPEVLGHRQAEDGAGTASPRIVNHLVVRGETITAIAARYGTTIEAIAAMNHLADPGYIQAGDILRVPTAATAMTAPTLPASLRAAMAKHAHVREIIEQEAGRAGVATSLALAVGWHESGWRQEVVSSAGARGVMQLLPTTATWIGDTMLGRTVDIRSTRDNIRAGIVLLRHYLARYSSVRRALAAYYQGERSADLYGILPVSQPYITSILALQEMLR